MMKKLFFSLITLLTLVKFSNAQTLNVAGTVKDEKGKPISLVSVAIEKQKSGIATDNSGDFKLTVPKYSKITISAVGYKDTALVIENEQPLNIVLKYAEKDLGTVTVTGFSRNPQFSNQIKNEILQAEFLHYKMENNISTGIGVYEGSQIANDRIQNYHAISFASSSNIYNGTAFPEFHNKEDTRGSLYLFKNWLNGIVSNNTDSNFIDDSSNFYNVNKITGDLVMTRDFKSALTVDKNQVKFFTLFDSLANSYSYVIVPAISPNLFCQIISLGSNYDIFKLTTTKFVKADYRTDGLVSTGNNYDEYVNTESYYLLNVQTGQLDKFDLKKKTVKQLFANVPKATDYLAQHKNDNLNDAFLQALGKDINVQQN